jgi:hypothetical protein
MTEEKLFAVVTKTTIISKPMSKIEAEKKKEKMLKKLSNTSKLRNTVRSILPKDMRKINVSEIVAERQKALENSIEILPYDDEKYTVVSHSSLMSKGRYTRERAEHLQSMIENTFLKIPSAGKIVTTEIVEAD